MNDAVSPSSTETSAIDSTARSLSAMVTEASVAPSTHRSGSEDALSRTVNASSPSTSSSSTVGIASVTEVSPATIVADPSAGAAKSSPDVAEPSAACQENVTSLDKGEERDTVTVAASPSATARDAGPIDRTASSSSAMVTAERSAPSMTLAGRPSAINRIAKVSSISMSVSSTMGMASVVEVSPAAMRAVAVDRVPR